MEVTIIGEADRLKCINTSACSRHQVSVFSIKQLWDILIDIYLLKNKFKTHQLMKLQFM